MKVSIYHPINKSDHAVGTIAFTDDGWVKLRPLAEGFIAVAAAKEPMKPLRTKVKLAASAHANLNPPADTTQFCKIQGSTTTFHPILLRELLTPYTSTRTSIAPMRSDDAPDPNIHVSACIDEWCRKADDIAASLQAAECSSDGDEPEVCYAVELRQPRFPEASSDLQDGYAAELDALLNDKGDYELQRTGVNGADVHNFVETPLGLGCAIQAHGEIGEPVSQWKATRSFASHLLGWWTARQEGAGA